MLTFKRLRNFDILEAK